MTVTLKPRYEAMIAVQNLRDTKDNPASQKNAFFFLRKNLQV